MTRKNVKIIRAFDGKILRKLRKDKNLTQDDLADILKVSFHTIGKWERGITEPPFRHIVKMADLFDVSIDLFAHRQHSHSYECRPLRRLLTIFKKRIDRATAERALTIYERAPEGDPRWQIIQRIYYIEDPRLLESIWYLIDPDAIVPKL